MEGGPEFLERSGCHYQFQWRHAAACQASGITQVRTTVTGTVLCECAEDQLEGGPESLERSGCHYQFQWRHAAACQASGITQVRTTVTGIV
jgi:hypothetical protein